MEDSMSILILSSRCHSLLTLSADKITIYFRERNTSGFFELLIGDIDMLSILGYVYIRLNFLPHYYGALNNQ